jgi:hypothetical protein
MTERLRVEPLLILAVVASLALPGLALAAGEAETGYGYFRTVEGEVQLTTFDKAEPIAVEPNYPVLTGDRLWVRPGSRVEMMLPDGSVLRVGDDSDLYLESLALSADNEGGDATVIDLLAGSLQIRVEDHFGAFQPTRVDIEGANIYLQVAGVYAIEIDDRGDGRMVVREGFAEVTTHLGSLVLRSGEASQLISGRAELASHAGGFLPIESWGGALDGYAVAGETQEHVDSQLAYAAAPLERRGNWVSVSGSWGWRPNVVGSWRPFSSGWWVHTPAGLSWVSNEPWGWVTTHYGVWDYAPGHGWIWFPGSYYSPAWVYWYWGPTHVAWVPAGYYSRFYGPSYGRFGHDFHFGVYGWAGGSWDMFGYWTFCPVRYFGRRGYNAYWRSGVEVGRFERYRAVPRGVITTDTRALHPGHWGKPQETHAALTRTALYTRSDRSDLLDVTNFVARQPNLDDNVRGAILRVKGSGGSAVPEVRGGISTTSRIAAAPWKPDRKGLPAAEFREGGSGVSSIFAGSQRDPAVARGARIETYRQPASEGVVRSQLGTSSSPGSRLGGGSTRFYVRPESDAGQIHSGSGLGTLPSVRALPPSARGSAGSGGDSGLRYYGDGASGDTSSPVIRQIIERMRSQQVAPQASPPSGSGSGSVSSSPSSGSSSRGSVSSGSSGSSRGGSVSSSPRSSGGSSKSSASSSRSSGSSRTSSAKPSKPPRL